MKFVVSESLCTFVLQYDRRPDSIEENMNYPDKVLQIKGHFSFLFAARTHMSENRGVWVSGSYIEDYPF